MTKKRAARDVTVTTEHRVKRVGAAGLEIIERLAREGVDNLTIARQLRMSSATLVAIRRRQPEVQEALDRGRAALSDELTHILMQHARDGNVVAAIYLTKARCGWREGDAPEQRANILIQLPDSQSPEAYLRMIDMRALPAPKPTDEGESK